MSRRTPPPRECRACRQPIQLFRSMQRADSWIAIDLARDTDGTVRRHMVGNPPVAHAELLTGDALNAAHADGELLWMLHRRTCTARKPLNPRPPHVQLHLPNRTASRRQP